MTSPTELVLKLAETNRYRIACKNTKGKYKEMKTEIRTVMVPTKKAFWVADDGTAFEKENDCENYELSVFRGRLSRRYANELQDILDCGKRLMLCDECLHSSGAYDDNCDYCAKTDSCRFNRNERN